jgi:hypothetical protein
VAIRQRGLQKGERSVALSTKEKANLWAIMFYPFAAAFMY